MRCVCSPVITAIFRPPWFSVSIRCVHARTSNKKERKKDLFCGGFCFCFYLLIFFSRSLPFLTGPVPPLIVIFLLFVTPFFLSFFPAFYSSCWSKVDLYVTSSLAVTSTPLSQLICDLRGHFLLRVMESRGSNFQSGRSGTPTEERLLSYSHSVERGGGGRERLSIAKHVTPTTKYTFTSL